MKRGSKLYQVSNSHTEIRTERQTRFITCVIVWFTARVKGLEIILGFLSFLNKALGKTFGI